jgi:23S rRNA (guanosine2251-2'-O)-methyltransferase
VSQELIYGIHAVQMFLQQAPKRSEQLLILQGRDDKRVNDIVALAKKAGVQIQHVTRQELEDKVDANHQGVILVCRPSQAKDESFLMALIDKAETPPLFLVLDSVTDPHNLGACLRSADAAGVAAVIAPKDKAVGLTSVVRKVACGAAETVPFVVVTNLARTLDKMKDAGIWMIGAAGEAEQSIYQSDFKGPMAIVMGAEGSGMRRLTRERCDFLANIPMGGVVTSLNVSVATGVFLFEALRQRSS